jgi:hypothetical protein
MKYEETYELAKKYNEALEKQQLATLEMLNNWYKMKQNVEQIKTEKMGTPKRPVSWWIMLLGNIIQGILATLN